MDKLAVTGDSIVLQPPPGAVFQWPGMLQLDGVQCGNGITAGGQPVVLEADLPMAALKAAGMPYIAPPFTTPGTIASVTLTVFPPTLSQSVATMGQKVITAGTQGTYTMLVGVPAMMPTPTGPVPDPLLSKVGQWTVQTVTQPFFQSGLPQPVVLESEDGAEGRGAGGAGAGASNETESEQTDHFVAVTVEDVDGNKLAGQFVGITLPTGERLRRELSGGGGTRVDAIRQQGDGTATVNMIFDPSLAKVTDPAPPRDFIAFEVIDESGNPLAGQSLTVAIAGAEPIVLQLSDKGRARIDGVQPNVESTVTLGRELEADTGLGDEDQEGDGDDAGDDAAQDGDVGTGVDAPVEGEPVDIAIVLMQFPKAPQSGRPFQITGAGNSVAGFAGENGLLEATLAGSAGAKLVLEATDDGALQQSFALQVAPLAPVQDVTAFFERLANLGYYRDVFPEEDEAERITAIEEFQCDYGLTVDGVKGPQTEGQLLTVHGS